MSNEVHHDSEEEILIYAEFEDSVNIEKYRSIHVLGADGKSPVIQMDDTFFTGKFENPLGTYLIFEEDPKLECLDPLFDRIPEKNLKYITKTRKLLSLKHAYVTPREDRENNVKPETQQPDDDIDIVNFSTVHEALEKFKQDFNRIPEPDINLVESSQKSVDSNEVMES